MPDKRDQDLPETRIRDAGHRLGHRWRDVLLPLEYHSAVSMRADL